MADTQGEFRCYYDDGEIKVQEYCPLVNENGSPLINSEYVIIEDVEDKAAIPWWLLIFVMVALLSEKKRR